VQVRHTASSQRSREEKQWVAMDVLVNPQCYTHVTEIEADEMRFDDDYEVTAQKKGVGEVGGGGRAVGGEQWCSNVYALRGLCFG
jgi:hypothetical protein